MPPKIHFSLAWLLVSLFCLEPACFALKTEKLFPVSTAASRRAGGAVEVASGVAFARFRTGIGADAKTKLLAGAGLKLLKEFDSTGWTLVGLPDGMAVSQGLALAQNITGIETVEPDRAYRVKRFPNDLDLAQYALLKVQAPFAWDYETGSSNTVIVAVLDTGIDATHPDLSGKLIGQSQFFDFNPPYTQSPDTPTYACNHATRVSGVAAASTDNGLGIAGMSWGAKLISLKVFNDNDCSGDCQDGTCGTEDVAIIAALDYARINLPSAGKVVVNMSLGSPFGCSVLLQSAINSAYAAGLLIVAASGNEFSSVDSPANCDHVIPVGATDAGDNLASFSNYGSEMTQGGLTAPGDSLLTTDIAGAYTNASGTSFSAPMVSGLAALIWSANPSLTNDQVWAVLKNSSDDLGFPGADQYFGFGRINAFKAVQLAVNGTFSDLSAKHKAYAYPNPFRPKINNYITFTIPADISGANLEIKIYTQEGELVKKLADSWQWWDGKNESGFFAASGVYIFYIKTDKGSAKGKFAVIR